ncbi:NAD(P)H-dependent glycerol-3-phosphate dehydrogenase [Parasporobacterium paucivorans]|uniref:Glycerol-3-phosphate dehydrogenase [NAD(P)+] n=1 Tax=Parasporobacterium paucivorans DSM 15970 TaxID=1122934 RepID=A0A1M6A0L0_9FIRM|nr:NAD(P)H-dependent glycerol-3-phosphate dehydrogenase [Parasporobacterium paucivorans]SHI30015.1 glycerol 3-phosphate dehydrogenase (NAD(P)+) [Parasporobacterium paucivorans DSM 15970]
MAEISVLGAGSWGIALGLLLHKNGHRVTMWSALESEVNMLLTEREHKIGLPGIKIPQEIAITSDLDEAVSGKDVIVMAVASKFVRATAHRLQGKISKGQIIVNVAKGIEDKTLMRLSEVIGEELPEADVAILSGPSHAEEVGNGMPTAIVVGAKTQETAEYLQNIFANDVFRVYTSSDVLGMELGAAFKNVIALAAGIADGLGYGDNTKAALITRGIKEIARLGEAMGAKPATIYGLSGIGDLIVTCASMHSRNRRAGILIGQGRTMEEAVKEVNMVVEGIVSARAATDLAHKYNVEMPITEKVSEVLFNNADAKNAVYDLMLRDKISEHEEMPWE